MNARQKAKKYKRMYENLLKKSVEFKVEQHKIDRVKFERFYHEVFISRMDNSQLRNIITSDIAYCLTSNIGKYIDYNMEFCPHLNKYRVYGEIKVVAKEEKND